MISTRITQTCLNHVLSLLYMYLRKVIFGNISLMHITNTVECSHGHQVNFLQVFSGQVHPCQDFPHRLSQVEVERLLGSHSHTQKNTKELQVFQVFRTGTGWVEDISISIETRLASGIRCLDKKIDSAIFQFLYRKMTYFTCWFMCISVVLNHMCTDTALELLFVIYTKPLVRSQVANSADHKPYRLTHRERPDHHIIPVTALYSALFGLTMLL